MAKFFIVFILALFLIGCASPKLEEMQTQELQGRINSLEKELVTKEEQIHLLEEELYQKEAEPHPKKGETLSITPKRIQAALKNAGFYKGRIDGKIGLQTKEAIKDFQKANGLKADGIVGKKTWEVLSSYLNQ